MAPSLVSSAMAQNVICLPCEQKQAYAYKDLWRNISFSPVPSESGVCIAVLYHVAQSEEHPCCSCYRRINVCSAIYAAGRVNSPYVET